ncbi:uncharacterized protein [Triticum aestivum]|uniref:uncharacterized protein isoform X2 n=1 Tax=Triticum aestivum TaxID=4565 RepID=UPI001D035A27|nr:uncharacterized protein LOC123044762 isoform X2 [Triticum aestivum]
MTCRQRAAAAPLDLICGREKMRGRKRRKNMRGGRKREERGEGVDGQRERITASAAGSSSFTPHYSRATFVQPTRMQLPAAGVLRGVRGRAPAGAARAMIWRPLFSATAPFSSFSSRDVNLQSLSVGCLCPALISAHTIYKELLMSSSEVVVGVARHVLSGFRSVCCS